MSEDIVIQQAAPTLAGIKTGSLFTYPCAVEQRAQFLEELRQFNRRVIPKGLRMIPVRFSEIRVLLYLFRFVLMRLCKKVVHGLDKMRLPITLFFATKLYYKTQIPSY